eukprot:34697_1
MGSFFARAIEKMVGKQSKRILMVGLDAAGKTTILYKLKLNEIINTIPTIGFNVETVEYKNIEFTVWDIGGQHKIRPLWRHYYHGADAIIFVVDSNDKERIDGNNNYDDDNARDQLHDVLSDDELCSATLLVFANKQDIQTSLSVNQISNKLQLNKLNNRDWYIQGASAKTGDGLFEGLDWLSNNLKNKKKK